jgi:hypothetical protein
MSDETMATLIALGLALAALIIAILAGIYIS